MIYLIDNDNSVRRAFELFFKSVSMGYSSFENAGEFMANCKPQSGDVIVLDYMLYGLSGCDVLKEFINQKIDVPVIIVSADDDPYYQETCRNLGVKAFLRKPVDIEALYDVIRFNLPVKIQ